MAFSFSYFEMTSFCHPRIFLPLPSSSQQELQLLFRTGPSFVIPVPKFGISDAGNTGLINRSPLA